MFSDEDFSSRTSRRCCVREIAAVEQLHDPHQRVQRIADVVAQRRQQVGFVFCDLFRLAPRQQQLPLVASAVGRIEQGDPVEERCAVRIATLARVDQHREDSVVAAHELECDFVREALHVHERRVMRFVIDLRADGQEALEFRSRRAAPRATNRSTR